MHKSLSTSEQTPMDAFLVEWGNQKSFVELATSGSTGSKKNIVAEKKFLLESAKMTGKYFGFTKNTSALHCLPMQFIAGKMMLLRIIAFQMKPIFCSPSDPLDFPDDLVIDFAAMTPLQYQKCLTQNEKKLVKIKTVLLGGAPIHPTLENTIKTLSHDVYHSYGMTETYSHVALRKVGRENNFSALDGIHFSVNEHNALVIHAPKLGHEALVTNDLVALIDDQSFLFRGRLDFVINSGGIKLNPEELERKISDVLPETNYFFAGVPDENLGQKLILFVEGEKQNIQEELSELMTKFERPKEIIFAASFCYTETGKLDRIKTTNTYFI